MGWDETANIHWSLTKVAEQKQRRPVDKLGTDDLQAHRPVLPLTLTAPDIERYRPLVVTLQGAVHAGKGCHLSRTLSRIRAPVCCRFRCFG